MPICTLIGLALSFLSGAIVIIFTWDSNKLNAIKAKVDARVNEFNRKSYDKIETVGWEKHFETILNHNKCVNVCAGIFLSAGFVLQAIGVILGY